jgi:hypothetical protein
MAATKAVYVRAKSARTFAFLWSGSPYETHSAYLRALRERNGGSVEEFAIVPGSVPPAAIASAGMDAFKSGQLDAIADTDEARLYARAALEEASGATGLIEIEYGVDEGLCLAVARILKAGGRKAHGISRYELFADQPATFTLAIEPVAAT